MSINISGGVARISKITAEVDLRFLGPRQRKSFDTMVRTGVIVGRGVPAELAWRVLESRNAPRIRAYRRFHWIKFHNVPLDKRHPLREALNTAGALATMQLSVGNRDNPSWLARLAGERKAAEQLTACSIYFGVDVSTAIKYADCGYEPLVGDTVTIRY